MIFIAWRQIVIRLGRCVRMAMQAGFAELPVPIALAIREAGQLPRQAPTERRQLCDAAE
jgi:hypothetical protein